MQKTIFACALAALTAFPALHADTPPATPAPSNPALIVPPAPDLTPERKALLLETYGFFLAGQTGIDNLALSPEEIAIVAKGFQDGLAKKTAPAEIQSVAEDLTQFFNAKAAAQAQIWDKKNKEYLADIDKQEGIQRTASGLRYKILDKGKSPIPTVASTVKALYKGSLVDGKIFDSTEKRNNEPATFPLNGVIPGWTEGLQKIGKGGKILLYIPQEIGYGTKGSPGGIPPMSTLVFEVELVDVMDSPPPAAPEAK